MDVFFISYKEEGCEANWLRTKYLHPNAIRLHGITGIDAVHVLCDQISTTEFFWTVDGDNWLNQKLEYNQDIDVDLLMFKAVDPFDGKPTLLGGVKLWRKGSMINKNIDKGDFSLNATNSKKVLEQTFSTTLYNSTPYDTWKTSFRHCVKLKSVIFKSRPNASNLEYYINRWAATKDSFSQNAEWAYKGFCDAEVYVNQCNDNLDELNKINNYAWLDSYYRELYGTP